MQTLTLKKTKKLLQSSLSKTLVNMNYEHVNMVIEPGEFSVRGSIVDIYPSNSTNPVRLEYNLDNIERLQNFWPHTQKATQDLNSIQITPYTNDKTLFNQNIDQITTDSTVISDLFPGDYIIHEHHGLGMFEGLQHRTFNRQTGEYICIRYKHNDHVYLPLNQLNKIHKYTQEATEASLHSLNTQQWNMQKRKTTADTLRLAEELFETYKQRQCETGYKFTDDTDLQLSIEQECPFSLTVDQKKAINDIKIDMQSPKPMERLLCGDVGFGKTECLIRATLKALENYKQVAILVPTTILAQQHLQTFQDRLKNTPYIIHSLSRFNTKSEQKKLIKALKENRCDCVIGTHRLLSEDIKFHDLGLLIVDEEQRFGVSHKEKIKRIKTQVDTINVSATPIPRTLYMSLSGARDMSVIETPPPNRKPIKTMITQWCKTDISQAISKELKREGQVYYIYNNIEHIHKKEKIIQEICPYASISVIHGRMKETHVKERIEAFKNKEYDIIISTTLIENGIDIPNANTIIIDGAEHFGLSQIHQLRGRVGRSSKQAYAYLFYKNKDTLTDKAKKRIQAIREYVALGSGYNIALKDLEIRGAGTLLGKEQHGHIVSVGFNYFCKLLSDAVIRKKGIEKTEAWLPLKTKKISISEEYMPDPRERMAFYVQFMRCQTMSELSEIKENMQDRFGRLSENIKQIFKYIETILLEK